MDKVKIKIKNCPRCHKDHDAQIKVKQFLSPMKFKDGAVITWWGLCPKTKDPILFRESNLVTNRWVIPFQEVELSIEWTMLKDDPDQSDEK